MQNKHILIVISTQTNNYKECFKEFQFREIPQSQYMLALESQFLPVLRGGVLNVRTMPNRPRIKARCDKLILSSTNYLCKYGLIYVGANSISLRSIQ